MLRSLTATSSANRLETLNGREYIVVPVVALTEGVYQCAQCPTPELYLAEHFAANVQSWNGRPITINHPSKDDMLVPAGTPEFFENSIGFIFNAVLEDSKLKVEAWIDVEKAENFSDESRDILNRLRTAQPVEISTGYFAKVDQEETGEFGGEVFNGIQRNVIPDHLAFLAHGTQGACSWADGCGAPRVNEGDSDVKCNCKDPKLNEAGVCEACTEAIKNTNVFPKILEKIKDWTFKYRGNVDRDNESDNSTRRALEAALNEEFSWAFVVDVFHDKGVFIFENDGFLWSRTFNIADDGGISLGDDLDKVRAVTDFVPVKINQEDERMNKAELITSLIANEAVALGEDERKWLEDQDEAVLAKLVPLEAKKEETSAEKTPEEKAPAEETLNANKGTTEEPEKPQTTEDFIASAPDEMRQVLNSGLKMHREKKAGIIKALTSNTRCDFTEEELEGRDVDELEKLAKIANVGDFTGRGLQVVHNDAADDTPPVAPVAFPLNKEA